MARDNSKTFGNSEARRMRYKTILADPPWRWQAFSTKGEGRSACQHYPTMTMPELFGLREFVLNMADKDCVLLCWAIGSMLPQAFHLMQEWGFKYKTVAFVWEKTNSNGSPFLGMGYWTRQNAEYCLLGTRGHPKRISKNISQIIISRRREHSRKPDEQYDRIEKLVEGPYLELFARCTHPGWTAWGNETDKFGNGNQDVNPGSRNSYCEQDDRLSQPAPAHSSCVGNSSLSLDSKEPERKDSLLESKQVD